MNIQKIKQTIGLAYASKNVILGTDEIVNAMKKQQVKLVVVSSEAAYNTQKLINNKSNSYDVDLVFIDEATVRVLSDSFNGRDIVVIGISDDGFKKLILKAIKGE